MRPFQYILMAICFCGCQHSAPELCRHRYLSVEAALIEKYGPENVRVRPMENYDKSTYTHHIQVQARPDGPGTRWLWAECPSTTIFLDKDHNPNCKPINDSK
jgi:hypothetical protein